MELYPFLSQGVYRDLLNSLVFGIGEVIVFALSVETTSLIKELTGLWLLQFCVATILMFFKKGEGALKWDSRLVRSARVNWSFIAANLMIGPLLILFSMVFSIWAKDMGLPTLPTSFWNGVPVVFQIAFALILIDFIEYWEHRVKHKSFLWPLHAVHHSDTQLNYTSWQRLHPLDSFLHHAFFVLLGTFLGLHYVSVGFLVLFRALHQQYVHMNLDWTHGPLEKFIASPRFHRWHHADTPEAYDKNFALMIPLWDHLFGTYYCPGSCQTETGFEDNPGDNFLALLGFPFKVWAGMIKRGLTRSSDFAEDAT